jgi:polar amino acid transport system substrate-binding protein
MLCLLKKEQIMHRHRWLISSALLLFSSLAFAEDIAPGGTLRAAYLANNPAQSVRDPVSGEIRGASADLARELARRRNVPLEFMPLPNPPAVIEAVTKGDADIGFVAYAPERVGTVEFSQTYMLVQQSFIVPDSSPIRAVIDIDALGRRIAGGKSDSITLYLARNLKQATLVETDNTPADAKRRLLAGEIDAFGANRQRLTNLLKEMPGYRILPDNLFGVTQTIAVAKGKPQVLGTINTFIDDIRASGFLQNAIARSGVVGLEMAPVGATLQR